MLRRFPLAPGSLTRRFSFWLAFFSLSLGLAVSGALFSVARDVLFDPLPYEDPDRLVLVWASDPARSLPRLEISWRELEAIKAKAQSVSHLAVFSAANFGVVIDDGERSVQLQGNFVSRGFFELLGWRSTVAGRLFAPDDFATPDAGVALLAEGAAREHFGDPAAAVGRVLRVQGSPLEIVGVLPRGLHLPEGAQLLFPLSDPDPAQGGAGLDRVLIGVARLASGFQLEQAEAELATLIDAAARSGGNPQVGIGAEVVALEEAWLGAARPALQLTLAMALVLLAMAVLNVVALRLQQSVARQSDLWVRQALGALPRDLLGLHGSEALAVALPAALVGWVGAALLIQGFRRLAPESFPRLAEVGVGLATPGLILLAALLTAVVIALLAARLSTRLTAHPELCSTRRGSADRMAGGWLDAIASIQVATALLLLVLGGLLARSFLAYLHLDPGFATDRVLTGHIPLSYLLRHDPARADKLAWLLEEIRALPEVEAAGSALMRPLEIDEGWDYDFTVEGQSHAEHEANPLAALLSVTPGYFEAIGTRLLAGRTFEADDRTDSGRVAVIGERFARRYWSSAQAAIGQRVKPGAPDSAQDWMTIVGVVADASYRGLVSSKLDLYEPFTQSIWSPNYLAVRTRGAPRAVWPTIAKKVETLFPGFPLSRPRTTGELLSRQLAQPRLVAWVAGTFAGTAVVLSLVGLAGTLAFRVRYRALELSLRIALGASPDDLRRLVFRRLTLLWGIGAVIGTAAAMAASRLVVVHFYGLEQAAWPVLAACAILLALLSIGAGLAPAIQASRTDPIEILRQG